MLRFHRRAAAMQQHLQQQLLAATVAADMRAQFRSQQQQTAAAAAAAAASSDNNLRALQQLPKLNQITRKLPANWQTAHRRFQRDQFLDPTRPDDMSARDYDTSQPPPRPPPPDVGWWQHQRTAPPSQQQQQQPSPKALEKEFQDAARAAAEQAGGRVEDRGAALSMPLPAVAVARPVPDVRLRVALVGAVNGGKSALWNRLVGDFDRARGRPRSRVPQIARDDPGLTRDAVEGIGLLLGSSDRNDGNSARFGLGESDALTVVDTPGVIDGQITQETKMAIDSCQAAVFVVACDRDLGRDELVMARYLAEIQRLPVVTILSKADLARHRLSDIQREAESTLGLGTPVPLSTYTDIGFDDLSRALLPLIDIQTRVRTQRDWHVEDDALKGSEAALEEVRSRNVAEKPIRVAFVGRTMSGKSSLVNCILGRYRSRARAGRAYTTRDTVETECTFRGRRFELIDTAPVVRTRTRRGREFVEMLFNATLRAINYADLVVICFDAREGHPSRYDMALAHRCAEEGRPFLFAANRWDQVLDPAATAEAIDFKIKRQINEIRYCHAVVTSAVAQPSTASEKAPAVGLNIALLLKELLTLHENWNKMIPARDLTRFWRKLERSTNIPYKNTRLSRIVQTHARPPTFVLKLQSKDPEKADLKQPFADLIRNAIAEEFDFRGVPLRTIQEMKEKTPDIVS